MWSNGCWGCAKTSSHVTGYPDLICEDLHLLLHPHEVGKQVQAIIDSHCALQRSCNCNSSSIIKICADQSCSPVAHGCAKYSHQHQSSSSRSASTSPGPARGGGACIGQRRRITNTPTLMMQRLHPRQERNAAAS